MSHKAAKVGITSLVLALAVGGLLYTSLGESAEYYKHVDEVTADMPAWHGKHLQLHGFAKQVGWKPGTLDYRFTVENNGETIQAFYTGTVPDTFKDDAEVVLKGTLRSDGTFHVDDDGIMAKCPSKYEAKPDFSKSSPVTTGTE